MPTDKESLHRLSKAFVDKGVVESFDEAEKYIKNLHINLFVGEEITHSLTLQAALVTIINTGNRTFLGGINIVSANDYPLSIPWLESKSLYEICSELGGNVNMEPDKSSPSIILGSFDRDKVIGSINLQVTYNGWLAGINEFGSQRLSENDFFPIAGVFAGSIAVSEAFLSFWSNNAMIGRRKIIDSLWIPGTQNTGPELYQLPTKLWIVGLGHLGQAVLWGLGFLPYNEPSQLSLVLQDFDKVVSSNLSTSLLTSDEAIGQMKTRWLANKCEELGIQTKIVERKFKDDLILDDDEPEVCLFLPDNNQARRSLQNNPFSYVVEAGLGSSFSNFTDFVLHTFPGRREPHSIWEQSTNDLIDITRLPKGYQELMDEGQDECGVLTLAGVAVGASFVGATTACYVISEVMRLINQGPKYDVIQGNLQHLEYLKAIEKANKLLTKNYGYTSMRDRNGDRDKQ